MPSPKRDTYPLEALPELLRSPRIGAIIAAELEATGSRITDPHSEGDPWSAGHAALAEVFTSAAAEIREWHARTPRPSHLNGE